MFLNESIGNFSQMRFSVKLFTNQTTKLGHQLWAESVVPLSPVVVHVFPFPWRPGGQGPQTKPAETWTLSKHWTPGWHGLLEHGDEPVGLGLSETCGTLAGVVAASLTGESWLPWKQIERWRNCLPYYLKNKKYNILFLIQFDVEDVRAQFLPSPLYPGGQTPQMKEPSVLLQPTPWKQGWETHSSISSLHVRPEKTRYIKLWTKLG